MKKRAEHPGYFSSGMRDNATDKIDVENKSRLSVADEAMGLLRGTFLAATQVSNVTFPRIVVAAQSRQTEGATDAQRATGGRAPPLG
mgnify:CR=1 FL=1